VMDKVWGKVENQIASKVYVQIRENIKR
jgi:hypothetical protein